MKKYTIYVDFFGKKMKVQVEANSEYLAIMKVNKSLVIDKVEEDQGQSQGQNDLDTIKDFLGIK
jgi:hypothetical protein